MRRGTLDVTIVTGMSMGQAACSAADWRAGLERAILAGMAYEYRVTEAEDGTFPVELWSSKGGRETLVYKTSGFQTRALAEAWTVPVDVQSSDPAQPRARVTYLKPRRSRAVIVSKPNSLPVRPDS